MIVGVGVDLVDVARFERSLARTPRLRERLFTPNEQNVSVRSLAGRFAAKEALIKALGGSDGVWWRDVEIISDTSRRPRVVLHNRTLAHVTGRGIDNVHVSLSHDGGLALAFVVLEGAHD